MENKTREASGGTDRKYNIFLYNLCRMWYNETCCAANHNLTPQALNSIRNSELNVSAYADILKKYFDPVRRMANTFNSESLIPNSEL